MAKKVNDFKRGQGCIWKNNEMWVFMGMDAVKPGKGPAYIQAELKNRQLNKNETNSVSNTASSSKHEKQDIPVVQKSPTSAKEAKRKENCTTNLSPASLSSLSIALSMLPADLTNTYKMAVTKYHSDPVSGTLELIELKKNHKKKMTAKQIDWMGNLISKILTHAEDIVKKPLPLNLWVKNAYSPVCRLKCALPQNHDTERCGLCGWFAKTVFLLCLLS